MSVRAATWVGVVAAFLCGSMVLSATAGQDKPKPARKRPFKPLMNVEQIMESQKWLSAKLKDAVNNAQWEDGEWAAFVLAEMGNVNIHHATDDKYAKMAGDMSKKAVGLAAAMKKQDEPAAKKAFSDLIASCKSCHDVYRKRGR